MDAAHLRAVEAQIANVYGMAGTEADFTETSRSSLRPPVWSGHAIFAKNGFVLDYTVPAGRRVVSNLVVTRIVDPNTPTTSMNADSSPYFALNILTGAIRPSFGGGAAVPSSMWCSLHGAQRATYLVDLVTSRVVRVQVWPQVDIQFTHIRVLAPPQANAIVSAF